MVEKNQQSNGRPNFRFGEMKTVIVPTINQLQTISSVLGIQKVMKLLKSTACFNDFHLFLFLFPFKPRQHKEVSMHARVTQAGL